ncbi:SDR family oxidoreductase [Pseudomonas sp. ODNR1LW]|nr:SDR family oxidoreductase [Pseudomonas sp. ODNR1LW]
MKRAIVTGGAGLIGRGICEFLAHRDWEVASFDRQSSQSDARQILCDISDEGSVAAAFDELGWPHLDLLVNNAGVADPNNGPLADLSLEVWRRTLDSHLTGAFLMSRAAIPLLGEGGSIINMVSTRAFMSEPETEAYAAAKGALTALTHAMAISQGPKLRVNAIAPGWIALPEQVSEADHAQHPVGRVGTPEDVAQAVLYLAEAGFVTGQVLTLDGGMTRKMIYAD